MRTCAVACPFSERKLGTSKGTTFHPMDISPAPPYTSPSLNVDPIGGNTERCSHAFGLPLSSSAAFMYMAATEW